MKCLIKWHNLYNLVMFETKNSLQNDKYFCLKLRIRRLRTRNAL